MDTSLARSDSAQDIEACRMIKLANVAYSKNKIRPMALQTASAPAASRSDSAIITSTKTSAKPALSKSSSAFASFKPKAEQPVKEKPKKAKPTTIKAVNRTKEMDNDKDQSSGPISEVKDIIATIPIAVSKESQRQHNQIMDMFDNEDDMNVQVVQG